MPLFLLPLAIFIGQDSALGGLKIAAERVIACPQSRAQLVLHPVVGTGRKVAAGAGVAIATYIGFPEKGFAQLNGAFLVPDEGIQVRYRRNFHRLERMQLGKQINPSQHRAHGRHGTHAFDPGIGRNAQQGHHHFPGGRILRLAQCHAGGRARHTILANADVNLSVLAEGRARHGGSLDLQRLLRAPQNIGRQVGPRWSQHVGLFHQRIDAGAAATARHGGGAHQQDHQAERERPLPRSHLG